MGHRIIHVGEESFLNLDLKSLSISRNGARLALIPIDDLAIVILDGPGIAMTTQAVSRLAESNVSLITCNEKHMPVGLLQPIGANSIHTEVLRQQIDCSQPKQKRLWQQIVVAKIQAQADLLTALNIPDRKLNSIHQLVKSGDSTNVEGTAAARYWKILFGADFIRDYDSPGANAMLNYGYAVLRSVVARSLCGTGLHPALGIHHHNRYNPYALADDAIEPLRPIVDAHVIAFLRQNTEPAELTPQIKKHLLKLLVFPVNFAGKEYGILGACDRYAASLKRGICEEARKVEIPTPIWSVVLEECG